MESIDNRASAEPKDHRSNTCFHHLRYVVIVAGGLAMGFMMFLRVSITVTMVSMVNHTQIFINEHPNMTDDYLIEHFKPGYLEVGEFDWNNEIQEQIITFYMITYTLFQFFTTRLIMRCGLGIGVAISLAVCAITNVLTPVMAYWGWQWMVLLRLINGCAASGVVPGMINLIECWTPRREHARGVVVYQFTGNILAVVAPLIGGLLASIHWKWAFYVPGAIVLVFCFLWFLLVSDNPSSSRLISQQELDLIKEDSSNEEGTKNSKTMVVKNQGSVPIYQIFKTSEFYCMSFIWCLYCVTSGGFMFLLPSYLHRVLKVPVDEIGMLTFVAQLGSLFSMLWPNQVADFFIRKFNWSLTSARQVVVFICVFMASVSLMYIAYSHNYLVVLVCIHRFFHMTHDTVFLATVMSQFGSSGLSGLVYSIFNSLGCINSTIFCVLVGHFLDYTGESLACWSWVFVVITLMNVLYFLIYVFFCPSKSLELQKSTDGGSSSSKDDKESGQNGSELTD